MNLIEISQMLEKLFPRKDYLPTKQIDFLEVELTKKEGYPLHEVPRLEKLHEGIIYQAEDTSLPALPPEAPPRAPQEATVELKGRETKFNPSSGKSWADLFAERMRKKNEQ